MIVVSGATGNVGRPLVAALSAAGEDVRGFSRSGAGAADLADPDSLAPVLAGAEAFYLLVPGAGVDGAAVVAAARKAGVRRIVLQSSMAAGTRPGNPLLALEDELRGSGLEWTVLRPGGFASNAFAWAESIRTARTAYAPYADVALPFVDPADIAAVGAAALRSGEHAGRTYLLTGPAATTPRERAAAIGAAIGAEVRFVEQTPEEARAQMLAFMPPEVADGTLEILGRPVPAERAVSPDVEAVLGRKASAFAEWASRNAAAFA